MTWHLHYTGESRDCDGRYSHGRDYPSHVIDVIGSTTGARGLEDDLDLVTRALSLIWRLPDTSPVNIRIDTESDGRISVAGGGTTDEGYWSESYVICDRDDFEPDYSGARDHSAERAGY